MEIRWRTEQDRANWQTKGGFLRTSTKLTNPLVRLLRREKTNY